MFEFKFLAVLLQGLCVHVCMCGEGRLRGRVCACWGTIGEERGDTLL